MESNKNISEQCPNCDKGGLIAEYDTPASDHPELSVWTVLCVECGFVVDSFPSIEWLEKEFTIKN